MPDQYSIGINVNNIDQLIEIIGRERLTAYTDQTGCRREALKLYALNARLSKHIFEAIGGFEVSLRNAISSTISSYYKRDDWYRSKKFLSPAMVKRRKNIHEVRKRLTNEGREVRTGRIVAGLSFHFWVTLHEKKYRDTIWTPYLHKIWPQGENIITVHKDLFKIRDLRNRIAHFEPIFQDKWKSRVNLIWNRFDQIAPEKSEWYKARLEEKINSHCNACDFA